MSKPTGTRREFIQTTAAAAAAFTIVPRHVLGGQKFVAPSDKVNVAIIGAGGQGRTNARALFQEERKISLSPTTPNRGTGRMVLKQVGQRPGRPSGKHYGAKSRTTGAVYQDFREMPTRAAIEAV